MILADLQHTLLLLAHGGNGDWDEYVLLLLAPVVIGGILWVTRRRDGGDEELVDEPQPAESEPASRD